MEIITTFKTHDGKLFEDKLEATKHENELKFIDWFVTNRDRGNLNFEKPEDFLKLLIKNRNILNQFMFNHPPQIQEVNVVMMPRSEGSCYCDIKIFDGNITTDVLIKKFYTEDCSIFKKNIEVLK